MPESIFERINKDNAMFSSTTGPDQYRNNILTRAVIGKVFNLPTILTTSAETGPNGPLPKEIVDMHPDAPFIKRNGELNAWDNSDFRKVTGKKQVILGGIVTDVCTAFLALSLAVGGYTVYANTDASGIMSKEAAADANDRMRAVGAHVLSGFAVVCDLMQGWRNIPGSRELMPYFDTIWVFLLDISRRTYAYLSRGDAAGISMAKLFQGRRTLRKDGVVTR
ncbi:Isochorismatase hydrolase [Pholiota conissans]|uniref:Isochorismatase hydrolase n=1 Tax=Pholiota conissans TaxID=109636 RepID=A0A9P6CNN3_9AGAR|nr:Isochorismatase hydrolase [Pholiota conissans]